MEGPQPARAVGLAFELGGDLRVAPGQVELVDDGPVIKARPPDEDGAVASRLDPGDRRVRVGLETGDAELLGGIALVNEVPGDATALVGRRFGRADVEAAVDGNGVDGDELDAAVTAGEADGGGGLAGRGRPDERDVAPARCPARPGGQPGAADLVFDPTPARGGGDAPDGGGRSGPTRRHLVGHASLLLHAAPCGGAWAGLTSKPHHAQQPRVALRGSFRLRLASTFNHRPAPGLEPA